MLTAENLLRAFIAGYENIAANEEIINNANVFPVPDGDTGTNMLLTLKNALCAVEEKDISDISALGRKLSYSLLRCARGNSGVIFSVAVSGFFEALKPGAETLTVPELYPALKNAAVKATKTVQKPEPGTILTLMSSFAECAGEYAAKYPRDNIFYDKLLKNAESALHTLCCETPAQKKAGTPDSGALALYIFLRGMIEKKAEISFSQTGGVSSSLPDYSGKSFCTQILIKKKPGLSKKELNDFCAFVRSDGDSAFTVDSGDIIKLHTHTDSPHTVLSRAMEIGCPEDIKIENMLVQMSGNEKPAYAFCVLYSGEGLKDIFVSLGASAAVDMGDSFNPDTYSILQGIDSIDADEIFVIANHKNAYLAANQAAKLSGKNVSVPEIMTFPEGISAMLAFDSTLSADENLEAMLRSAGNTETALIAKAAKDSFAGKKKIRRGQYFSCLKNGETVCESNLLQACIKAAGIILRNGKSSLNIIYGEDTVRKTAEEICRKAETVFGKKTDITLLEGGQKVYSIILSAT